MHAALGELGDAFDGVALRGTHGTLATVMLVPVSSATLPQGERERIEQRVHERLNPFVIRHQIAWAG